MDIPDLPTFVRSLYGGQLTPGRVAQSMMAADALFPTRLVTRAEHVRLLPVGPALPAIRLPMANRVYDLVDYLSLNRVTGLLVLHRGAIVREDYELGLTPSTRHASFSLAKSVCSTLIGCALHDGHLSSLDDPLVGWLPALHGSAYEQVSLRALLSMRTGVAWDETYTHAHSDRRRFLDAQLTSQPGALLSLMTTLKRRHPLSEAFNYSTGETFLVGAVLEAAVGEPLACYLSRRLWQPLGMEQDATWWVESPGGVGMGGSGLSATLRDYGRFAQFVASGGSIDGHRLVPEHWFAESTRTPEDGTPYGYQWWLAPTDDARHRGAFFGMGIFGQRLYINPLHGIVAVVLAARSKPSDSHVIPDEDFFGALVDALSG